MSKPEITSGVQVVNGSFDVKSTRMPQSEPFLTVRSFGMTDKGKSRPGNEDQFLVASLHKALQIQQTSLPHSKLRRSRDRSYLFIVADGLGGHAGGRHASMLAIDSVELFVLEAIKWFAHCKGKDQDQVLADFQGALGHANACLLAEAMRHPELRGMATTLTLAFSLNNALFVAHVGDSRCYLIRNGDMYRLTHDHTLTQEMVSRGLLSPEEAAKHSWRHTVTNVVGGDEGQVKVEVHKLLLEAGDVVLLCSDGLTEMMAEKDIANILRVHIDPEQACRHLVESANEAGGHDNITVVVARFLAFAEAGPSGGSHHDPSSN